MSATPLSAPIILARAGEVLVSAGCSFKFGTDIRRVVQLNDARYDRGGYGRFITVYPSDDDQFRVLVESLHEVTAGLAGPQILSDRELRPGSLVHFRYGEFTPNRVFTDDGKFETRMIGPNGEVVADERRAWFSPPAWATSPFETDDALVDEKPESVLLNDRFRVTRAIRHANKGGVYVAVDELTGADVVVKQARAHVGARLDGSDLRDCLREEARLLDELAPLGVSPAGVALFGEEGDLFLVQEYVAGEPLNTWAARRVAEGGCGTDEALEISRGLVQMMQKVHEAGFVIRDFKPPNVIRAPAKSLSGAVTCGFRAG